MALAHIHIEDVVKKPNVCASSVTCMSPHTDLDRAGSWVSSGKTNSTFPELSSMSLLVRPFSLPFPPTLTS